MAVAFLDDLRRRGNQALVSDFDVAEACYCAQYHYGAAKADALAALAALFQGGEIAAAGHAGQVLTQSSLASAKPGFVDRLIHAAYTETGGTMVTFEKAGRRLPGVTVLNGRRARLGDV